MGKTVAADAGGRKTVESQGRAAELIGARGRCHDRAMPVKPAPSRNCCRWIAAVVALCLSSIPDGWCRELRQMEPTPLEPEWAHTFAGSGNDDLGRYLRFLGDNGYHLAPVERRAAQLEALPAGELDQDDAE